MPRFEHFAKVFPQEQAFTQLLAYLFEDVLEFHKHAYAMIRKPGTDKKTFEGVY